MPVRTLDGVTILVVEDHDDSREAVTAALRSEGAQVFAAPAAQEALLLIEEHRPDIIVTDLEMPDMDGWGLMRALRTLPAERGRRIPVVALSVHNTYEDRLRSLKAGFRLHLAKPFDPTAHSELLAALVATSHDADSRG